MQWRVGLGVDGIDIDLSIKEELDALVIAIQRCEMQWGIVAGIDGIDIGMPIKKELDTLMMAFA